MHQRIMVIHIHIKFHQILLNGCLVMAPDGCDGQMNRHGENYIPLKIIPNYLWGKQNNAIMVIHIHISNSDDWLLSYGPGWM